MHTKQQIKGRRTSEMVALYVISQPQIFIIEERHHMLWIRFKSSIPGVNCSILISLYII